MAPKYTILIADNNQAYRETTRALLEREGYAVIEADSPEKAIEILNSSNTIDLALLDLRMKDDKEGDYSGLKVASETPLGIPKMIITEFPSAEAARSALGPRIEGPALAADFLFKGDGPRALLTAVTHLFWKLEMEQLDAQASEVRTVRMQANVMFWISAATGVTGILLIVAALILMLAGRISDGLVGIVVSAIIEGAAALIYQRSDIANARADRAMEQIRERQTLRERLEKCDTISDKTKRDDCIRDLILPPRA